DAAVRIQERRAGGEERQGRQGGRGRDACGAARLRSLHRDVAARLFRPLSHREARQFPRFRPGDRRQQLRPYRRGMRLRHRSAVRTEDLLTMSAMTRNGVTIDDTFAEAFGMSGIGLVITADTMKWARISAEVMTGFGTSVIGCGAECGIDRELSPDETPDGRPGVRVLLFGFSPDALKPQLANGVGQCVLARPGSAC